MTAVVRHGQHCDEGEGGAAQSRAWADLPVPSDWISSAIHVFPPPAGRKVGCEGGADGGRHSSHGEDGGGFHFREPLLGWVLNSRLRNLSV